jgi:TonB family protein
LSNLIRTSSLLLVFVCAAACAGFAQEKEQPQKKKEKPYATGVIIKLPAEYKATSWKEYKSETGGFSIMFPGTPREEAQKLKDGGHEVNIRTLNLHEMAIYSVMYLDNPPSAPQNPDAARVMLDYSVKQAAPMFKAEPLEEVEITLDGHPGRFVRQRLPDGLIMRLKFYVVGQRLYQLMITTPSEQAATDDQRRFYAETASKFLDSFKLAPTTTTTAAAPTPAAQSAGDAGARARREAQIRGLVRAEDDTPPAPEQKGPPRVPVSGGIINGKTILKPSPAYPDAARESGVSGPVEVAVLVGEDGRVLEAEAVSGPVELREAAVTAARKARFAPTRLAGQLVKIRGRLTYNFVRP